MIHRMKLLSLILLKLCFFSSFAGTSAFHTECPPGSLLLRHSCRRHPFVSKRSPLEGEPLNEIQLAGRCVIGSRGGHSREGSQWVLFAESSNEVRMSKGKASSYALVWSPGFLPKFGLSIVALLALNLSGVMRTIGTTISSGCTAHVSHRFSSALLTGIHNFALPLLSSSCCLLQLSINALIGAGGCAGFNTVLGPVRPVFLALLLFLNLKAPPTLGKALVRIFLSLLPEMLDIWNRFQDTKWKEGNGQHLSTVGKIEATISVDIPTMGCVACINNIDRSLRQSVSGKIIEASSWLHDQKKGGQAKIRCTADSEEDLDYIKEAILGSIEKAGFPRSTIQATSVTNAT